MYICILYFILIYVLYVNICICMYIHVCKIYVCMYIYTYIYVYIYIYTYTYTHTYIYTHTHTHIHRYVYMNTFYRICINEFGEMLGQFILGNWCQFLNDCETTLDKTKIDRNRTLQILKGTLMQI